MNRLEGVLPVFKPSGLTSHDVVGRLRKMLNMKRIGHTGTLDPLATGVLPVCLGRSTRLAEYIQDRPKCYEATLRFGMCTDTDDLAGRVLIEEAHPAVTEAQIRRVLPRFVGTIRQIPPMYSAVKIDGQRLYHLARQGLQVERPARQVEIYRIEIIGWRLDQPFPEVRFEVECSKGTYIRTLCVDIGRALELPAVMSDLVRTMSGNVRIDGCVTLDQIKECADQGTVERYVIPADRALDHFPACTLTAELAKRGMQGRKIALDELSCSFSEENELCRVYSEEGQFTGIFKIQHAERQLVPHKIFLDSQN